MFRASSPEDRSNERSTNFLNPSEFLCIVETRVIRLRTYAYQFAGQKGLRNSGLMGDVRALTEMIERVCSRSRQGTAEAAIEGAEVVEQLLEKLYERFGELLTL